MDQGAFVTYIYQPFFNILVFLYWLVGQIFGEYDMGIAVILFALVVQIILLPLSLSSDKSEKERHEIAEKIKKIEEEFAHDPANLRAKSKEVMRSNPGAVISETINIIIQFIIIIMLYRIFKTGLEGEDFHLMYRFMPEVRQPINLVFLGKFDLSRTNSTLNILQSLAIFAIEGLHMIFTPSKISRRQFLQLALFLPIVSFFIFMLMPAGKKVFIITSILFSIGVLLVKQAIFWYHSLTRPAPVQAESVPEQPQKS